MQFKVLIPAELAPEMVVFVIEIAMEVVIKFETVAVAVVAAITALLV